MKKRVLALLICACMLIGMVPVFANEIAESGSTSSSSVEGTTSSAETGSAEGTGDASEPPVDNGDASEPPVDTGDTSEPPVDNGDTSEPPVDNGDTSEPPVDTGDASEPPVDIGDASEPPVDNGDSSEPPVDPEQPVGPEHPIVVPPENLLPSIPEFPNPFPPIELECTCGAAEGEEHAEGCPLYVKPEFDVETAYEYLMNCETTAEMESYRDEYLTEDMIAQFSDEQVDEIEAHYAELMDLELMEEEVEAAVNYDNVAEFAQAISDSPVRRKAPSKAFLLSVPETDQVTPTDVDDNNGLELSKTVEETDNGYQLKLEAYTTGKVQAGTAKPSDIILVLDMSTSMENSFSQGGTEYRKVYELDKDQTYYVADGNRNRSVTWCDTCNAWTRGCRSGLLGHTSGTEYTPKESADDNTPGSVQFYTGISTTRMNRLEALQQAATLFVEDVAGKASEDRIAVVGFGQNAYYLTGTGPADALLDATTEQSTLLSAINSIGTGNHRLEGSTEHGKGMENAVSIFNAQTDVDYTNRNKVVILFTDGEPAPQGTNNWSSRVVKQTIENSYVLKNEHNAAVYTVSVMPGTDASNPTSDMDKYMDYISSNYPGARYLGNSIDDRNNNGNSYYSGRTSNIIAQITPGDKADTSNGSFYLTAGDIDTLESIFGQISDQTGGASIALDAETVISDVISDYFELPQGADESSITVDTQDAVYNGGTLSWTTTTIQNFDPAVTISGKTIDVNGFDFNRNFVAEKGRTEGDVSQEGDFHGRKLIITIPVVVRDGFWGGNQVPTNGNASAVYDKNGNLVETFEVPHVDVEIKDPEIEDTTSNIYFAGTKPSASDLNGYTKPADSWATDFVTFNTTTPNSNTISNVADGDYAISVTVSPKTEGNATAKTATGNAHVNVFVPEVTFTDSTIYLSQTPGANYPENTPTVTWWHGENQDTTEGIVMIGTAPTDFTYGYDVAPGQFTDCTTVQGKITKVGTTDYVEGNLDNNTFTVHVLKPTVTWQDTSKYYGEDLPTSFTPSNVQWLDGNTSHGVPEGTQGPSIVYYGFTFVDENNNAVADVMPKDVVLVDVNAKIGNFIINDYIHYEWAKGGDGCTCNAGPENHEFRIHPKFCTLIVNKDLAEGSELFDDNDSFLFTVTGSGNKYSELVNMQVIVEGKGETKITGLPVGTYTVTEDTNWSWRYTTDDATDTATLSSSNVNGTTAITNTLHNEKWLSGSSIAENTWSANNTQVERTKGPGLLEKIRKLFG